jgi:hypothetical protein
MELLSTIVLFNAFIAFIASLAITFMNIRFWIKFLLIPIIVITTIFCINSFEDMSGFPYHDVPKGDFELIKHRATLNSEGEIVLQVWCVQEGKSRLFEFSYDPGLDQAMSKAEGEKGHKMIFNLQQGKFKGKKGHHLGLADDAGGGGFSVRDGSPAMPPKDDPR